MKKSEKMLSVMERRAEAGARLLEQGMNPHEFTLRYHYLYYTAALPWLALTGVLGLFLHIFVQALWAAVICDGIALVFLWLFLDWRSYRGCVSGNTLTVTRLWIFKKQYDRGDFEGVRIIPESKTESRKLVIKVGRKKMLFVPEMIGFELLAAWAKK